MVMRSPCAGDALDPPLWKIPNKALSLSLSLSLNTWCLSGLISLSLSLSQVTRTFLHAHGAGLDAHDGFICFTGKGVSEIQNECLVSVDRPPPIHAHGVCILFCSVMQMLTAG